MSRIIQQAPNFFISFKKPFDIIRTYLSIVLQNYEMHLNKNDSAEMLIEENNEVFINTENVDARIEQEKEMFKEFNE